MRQHAGASLVAVAFALSVRSLLAQPAQAQRTEDSPDEQEEEHSENHDEPENPLPSEDQAVTPHVKRVDGMVWVKGSSRATFGSVDKRAKPNEGPRVERSVHSFWIDEAEVTVADYRGCVASKKCDAPVMAYDGCDYQSGTVDLPVNCIDWGRADNYCKVHAKRLPREDEWEYAASAGTQTRYPWGYGKPNCGVASMLFGELSGKSCTGKYPGRVKSRARNRSAFGVYDLAGNVEEWVGDFYVEHRGATPPSSGASYVLRGGGYLSPASDLRVTARNWGSSREAGPNVGFRCARD